MMLPVQITARDIPISPALESNIRKRTEKLKRFYSRISSCRVVIEIQQKHKRQGKLFNVRIDLTVPRKEMVVTKKYDQDVYVAIRDAFNAMERQLEEHARKKNGKVKTHNDVMYGRITRIVPDEGFGFIEGIDGHEYYFSLTNVTYPHFDQILIGDYVEYMVGESGESRQANHVVIKEKQRQVGA